MNEFGQLMEMELYDSNGVYLKVENTYEEIPVESWYADTKNKKDLLMNDKKYNPGTSET